MRNNRWLIILPVLVLILGMVSCVSPAANFTTGNIKIHVADKTGNPLQGAKVASNSQPAGQLKVTGLTDDSGSVIFNDVKTGTYDFYISRFDYAQTELQIKLSGESVSVLINMVKDSGTALVTFAQLTAEPDRYNGKKITIEGFYFDGFEIVALCESLVPSTFRPGNVMPQGSRVWLKGGPPQEVHEKLFVQNDTPSSYPEHYGKVKLTGILEYGAKYGHLDQYEFLIDIEQAELLSWSPKND